MTIKFEITEDTIKLSFDGNDITLIAPDLTEVMSVIEMAYNCITLNDGCLFEPCCIWPHGTAQLIDDEPDENGSYEKAVYDAVTGLWHVERVGGITLCNEYGEPDQGKTFEQMLEESERRIDDTVTSIMTCNGMVTGWFDGTFDAPTIKSMMDYMDWYHLGDATFEFDGNSITVERNILDNWLCIVEQLNFGLSLQELGYLKYQWRAYYNQPSFFRMGSQIKQLISDGRCAERCVRNFKRGLMSEDDLDKCLADIGWTCEAYEEYARCQCDTDQIA